HRITSPWKWRHLKSVIVPSVQSPPSMLKLHDFCNRALGRLLILLALLVIAGNAIQRLKDAGVTPWMLLLWFIPFVGLAILAILLLLPGRKPVGLPVAPPSSPYVGGK
ncbi:DUF805 domain-containing protein, partial [Pseudomonas aeruginosa]|uniref:DUF805 domain-containing protein n=1 Tax=Pseudomonas aeruginosa TaxID=287 RepID=UPI002DB97AEF